MNGAVHGLQTRVPSSEDITCPPVNQEKKGARIKCRPIKGVKPNAAPQAKPMAIFRGGTFNLFIRCTLYLNALRHPFFGQIRFRSNKKKRGLSLLLNSIFNPSFLFLFVLFIIYFFRQFQGLIKLLFQIPSLFDFANSSSSI